MYRIFIVIFLLIVACEDESSIIYGACGIPDTDSLSVRGIIGGHLDRSNFHCIVRVKQNRSECSAVVISERLILTAAHCVDDPVNGVIRIADHNNKFLGKSVKYFYDNRYDNNFKTHDIAIILSDRDINLPKPSLPDINDDFLGNTVSFSGYGVDYEDPDDSRDRKWGSGIVVDKEDGNYIVSESEDTISCFGDSGGGLFYGNTLIGINSWAQTYMKDGVRYCNPKEARYLSIVDHLDWIEEKMEELNRE
jgi:secreted trypsin-like serine protease